MIKINDIELTQEEWSFLKKYIIEDALEFHSSVLKDFGEFAPDLTNELYDVSQESEFTKHKDLFKKLNQLGIKTFNLED